MRKLKTPVKLDTHGQVVKAILDLIRWRIDVFAWKNNTGSARIGTDRFISFGYPGSPDIIGATSDGVFLGIEVKVGRDKQNPKQKEFEENIRIFGGRYFLTHDVDAVVHFLDSLKLPQLYDYQYFNKHQP